MGVSKLAIVCVVCVLFVALADSANTKEKSEGFASMKMHAARTGAAAKGVLARMNAEKLKGKKSRNDHLKKKQDEEYSEGDSSCEESLEEDDDSKSYGDDYDKGSEEKKRRMSKRLSPGKSRSGGPPNPKPSAKTGKR